MKKQESMVARRLSVDYPRQVWAIGWIAVLKAVVWLSSEPYMEESRHLFILGCKYAVFMIPWLVCAVGAWRMKRWAAWGLAVLCIADLLFFAVFPFARESLALNPVSSVAYLLSLAVFVVNGPVSAVVVLALLPALFRQSAADGISRAQLNTPQREKQKENS